MTAKRKFFPLLKVKYVQTSQIHNYPSNTKESIMNRCSAVGSSKITEMSQTLSHWSSRLEAPRLMLIFVSHIKTSFWWWMNLKRRTKDEPQKSNCYFMSLAIERWPSNNAVNIYSTNCTRSFGHGFLLLWRSDDVLYCGITHTCPKRIHFINFRRTNKIYVCFVHRPVCCVIFLGLILFFHWLHFFSLRWFF